MKTKLDKLRAQYVEARTEADRERVFEEIRALIDTDAVAVAEAATAQAREIVAEAETIVARDALRDVLPAISVAYIARNYFGRSRAWLTQRINGNAINGKRATFTPEELQTMRAALRDLSGRLAAVEL